MYNIAVKGHVVLLHYNAVFYDLLSDLPTLKTIFSQSPFSSMIYKNTERLFVCPKTYPSADKF